jgi:hypothetical protein
VPLWFFVELGAEMIVASTMVPCFRSRPFSSSREPISVKIALVSSCSSCQVPETEDGALIRHRILAELHAHEATHGFAVVDRILGGRIGKIEPVLEKVDPQHLLEPQRRAAPAALRVVRLDETDQPLPGDHHVHLREEALAPGELPLAGPGDAGEGALICHRKSRCGGCAGWTEKSTPPRPPRRCRENAFSEVP